MPIYRNETCDYSSNHIFYRPKDNEAEISRRLEAENRRIEAQIRAEELRHRQLEEEGRRLDAILQHQQKSKGG